MCARDRVVVTENFVWFKTKFIYNNNHSAVLPQRTNLPSITNLSLCFHFVWIVKITSSHLIANYLWGIQLHRSGTGRQIIKWSTPPPLPKGPAFSPSPFIAIQKLRFFQEEQRLEVIKDFTTNAPSSCIFRCHWPPSLMGTIERCTHAYARCAQLSANNVTSRMHILNHQWRPRKLVYASQVKMTALVKWIIGACFVGWIAKGLMEMTCLCCVFFCFVFLLCPAPKGY